MTKTTKSILIVLIILLIDQLSKYLVKTNMTLYQDLYVFGNWFIIKFIENDGMAFGLDLPGNYGKLVLSLFRIAAVIGIGFYLRYLIRLKSPTGLVVSVSLILAGALGNIIDSVFYGIIYNQSTQFATANLFPADGGYASLMHGHVVDMFYFPIIRGYYPDWIPWKGGDPFEFFRPVFNVADSSISIGVGLILVFQKRFFLVESKKEEISAEPESDELKVSE